MQSQSGTKNLVIFSLLIGIITCFVFDIYLNPLIINSGGDCCVYLEMGLAICKGKIPYYDLFDHKGIILYIINALGIIVQSGHWGVFALACINMSICVFLWMKTTNLFIPRQKSKFVVILMVLVYGIFADRGNNPEEWALLLLSFSNYIFIRNVVAHDQLPNLSSFLIGVCLGILSFIKVNTVVPVIASCLMLIYVYVKRRNYKVLVNHIIFVVFGWALVSLIVIYLFGLLFGFSHIKDLYYGSIMFNLEYISEMQSEAHYNCKALIFVFLFIFAYWQNRKATQITHILLYVFLSFFLMFLINGRFMSDHYFIILIPLLSPLFSALFSSSVLFQTFLCKICFMGLAIMAIVFITSHNTIRDSLCRGRIYERGFLEFKKKYEFLPDKEKDSIWNYNGCFNGLNCLYVINSIQMNRIILPFQHEMSSKLKEIGTIFNNKPLRIMVDEEEGVLCPYDSAFISKYYYKEFMVKLKTENNNNLLIYKRK